MVEIVLLKIENDIDEHMQLYDGVIHELHARRGS